jgi:hypothetical protein
MMCLLWGTNLVFISHKTAPLVTAVKTSNLTQQPWFVYNSHVKTNRVPDEGLIRGLLNEILGRCLNQNATNYFGFHLITSTLNVKFL